MSHQVTVALGTPLDTRSMVPWQKAVVSPVQSQLLALQPAGKLASICCHVITERSFAGGGRGIWPPKKMS